MKKLVPFAVLMLVGSMADSAFGAVEVEFVHPENFTDISSQFKDSREMEASLGALRGALVQRGEAVLMPGQDMKITVTDVDLAGMVRSVVTGIRYGADGGDATAPQMMRVAGRDEPPAIKFSYAVLEHGQVTQRGAADLVDIQFPRRDNRYWRNDPLRNEKPMLDDWFGAEFGKPIKVARR